MWPRITNAEHPIDTCVVAKVDGPWICCVEFNTFELRDRCPAYQIENDYGISDLSSKQLNRSQLKLLAYFLSTAHSTDRYDYRLSCEIQASNLVSSAY